MTPLREREGERERERENALLSPGYAPHLGRKVILASFSAASDLPGHRKGTCLSRFAARKMTVTRNQPSFLQFLEAIVLNIK